MLSSRHEQHWSQHPGYLTRKSRRDRIIFFKWGKFEKKNPKTSALIYTHGCITTVLPCIHMLLKLNSLHLLKNPRGLDALGCTDLQLPQGGSGVTQKNEHKSLNLSELLKACTMQWMLFVQVYYVYLLGPHALTTHLYKWNFAYFHTQKWVFLRAIQYFYFLVARILFVILKWLFFSSSNYKCTEAYFPCIYYNSDVGHGKACIRTKTPLK